ncbi:MAG TPA: DHA2 family efflux MFS transporter permease subunit [Miltoncostaeaceae bacterium]|nr:DHA2 family efflux MFS transporter permease subunit [Miltoncostaeaceae bacterium]
MRDRAARRLAAVRARLLDHPRWRWMALMVVASGMMLSIVNVSIVNIALPTMAADLGVDVPSISWVVTGFLVTQATLLALAGRAGDLYGRRRVFVAGVLVLCGASVLCAVAPNAPALVAFRILQAVGACAMAPTAYAYAAELFVERRERGVALGLMGGVLGLAPVLSLNIAGVLVGVFGWRSVFWFTPVMGVVVLAGDFKVLVEAKPPDAHRRFDVPGAALAAVGLFSVLVALSRGEAWGWAAAPTIAAFVLGGAALAGFVRHELRTPAPMIDLRLLRRRALATANLAAMASSAALFGTLILLPFYLTAVLGFAPVQLAIGITPIAGSFMVVAPLAGRAIAPVGSERLATIGFVVAAAGAVWMALAAGAQSYAALLPGIIAFGVGLATSTSSITMTAIDGVPAARLGVASALPNISRYIGGALGAAVLGAVLHANLPGALEDALGRVDADGRGLVADGFRSALLVAAAFLVAAALAASRMPRLGAREPAAAAAAAPLDAPAAP